MKTYTIQALTKMCREGEVEAETDIKVGNVNIRWTSSGKREVVRVA